MKILNGLKWLLRKVIGPVLAQVAMWILLFIVILSALSTGVFDRILEGPDMSMIEEHAGFLYDPDE